MKTTSTDKFSLARTAALWRLASPGMGLHVGITAGITAAAYGLSLLATYMDVSLGLYTLAMFIISGTAYCGPLHFARFRDKAFAAQIPATAGERTAVVSLYSFVFIPAVIAAVWFLSMGIAAIFSDNYDVNGYYITHALAGEDMEGLRAMAQNTRMALLQRLQDVVPIGVCLYVVICSRRSAVVHGLLGVVCALIAMSFLGGIYGIVLAFNAGLSDAMAGKEFNPEGFTESFTSGLPGMVDVIAVVSLAALAVMIWMIYRKFSRRRI